MSFATTRGSITGAIVTDNTGHATAALTSATNVGAATVTATAGNASDNTTVEFVAGPPVLIRVTANPASVKADGSSTVGVTALVQDAFHNPVPNQTVIFATTLGAISGSGSTDSNGRATATLTAAATAGMATVTATIGAVSGSATVHFVGAPRSRILLPLIRR